MIFFPFFGLLKMDILSQGVKFKNPREGLGRQALSYKPLLYILLYLSWFFRLRLCHRFHLLLILYYVAVCSLNDLPCPSSFLSRFHFWLIPMEPISPQGPFRQFLMTPLSFYSQRVCHFFSHAISSVFFLLFLNFILSSLLHQTAFLWGKAREIGEKQWSMIVKKTKKCKVRRDKDQK